MQKSNFENKVHHAFDDFKLQPSSAVWNAVEQKLAKTKSRKRLIFFWSLGIGFLVLLTGGLFLLKSQSVEPVTTNSIAASKNTNEKKLGEISEVKQLVEEEAGIAEGKDSAASKTVAGSQTTTKEIEEVGNTITDQSTVKRNNRIKRNLNSVAIQAGNKSLVKTRQQVPNTTYKTDNTLHKIETAEKPIVAINKLVDSLTVQDDVTIFQPDTVVTVSSYTNLNKLDSVSAEANIAKVDTMTPALSAGKNAVITPETSSAKV